MVKVVPDTWGHECNWERRLGVTWAPDPDWDLLTSVWPSKDTHVFNLSPLTSCCGQNHPQDPCLRSGSCLDRSNSRRDFFFSMKEEVISIDRSSDVMSYHMSWIFIKSFHRSFFIVKKEKIRCFRNRQAQKVTRRLYGLCATAGFLCF